MGGAETMERHLCGYMGVREKGNGREIIFPLIFYVDFKAARGDWGSYQKFLKIVSGNE